MTSPDRTAPDAVPADEHAPIDGESPTVGATALSDDTPVAGVNGPAAGSALVTGEIVPPAADASGDELSGTIAALTADDLDQSERRRLLGRLAGQIRLRGIGDLFRPKAAMRWIADTVSDVAPRLPIRDRETLRRRYPGLSDDALAARLTTSGGEIARGVYAWSRIVPQLVAAHDLALERFDAGGLSVRQGCIAHPPAGPTRR